VAAQIPRDRRIRIQNLTQTACPSVTGIAFCACYFRDRLTWYSHPSQWCRLVPLLTID